MDAVFGELLIVIVAFMTSLYTGWVMDTRKLADEIGQSAPFFNKVLVANLTPAKLWIFFIRFVCPVVIGLVLLSIIGIL